MHGIAALTIELIFEVTNRNMENDGCEAGGNSSDPLWTLC